MPERNIDKLDLNLIRPLGALLEHVSVSQAALSAGMTQPSMSKALGRLRTQLQDPLLVRVKGRMELTEHAQAMRGSVRDILRRVDHLITSQRDFDPGSLDRTYFIGTPDYAEALIIPPLLARITAHAPKVRLRIIPLSTNSPARLELGELDGLLAPPFEEYDALKARRLFRERFCCVVRKDHPTVNERLSVKHFCELKHLLVMVTPDGPVYGPVDRTLAEQGLTRQVTLTVNGFFAAAPILAQTDLVATLPLRVARLTAKLYPLRLVPLPLKLTGFDMSLLWHTRRHSDPDHVWLRQQIVQASKTLEGSETDITSVHAAH